MHGFEQGIREVTDKSWEGRFVFPAEKITYLNNTAIQIPQDNDSHRACLIYFDCLLCVDNLNWKHSIFYCRKQS